MEKNKITEQKTQSFWKWANRYFNLISLFDKDKTITEKISIIIVYIFAIALGWFIGSILVRLQGGF